MDHKKIRIGIVGCGGMAKNHAMRFGNVLNDVEVTAVVDTVTERAEAVAALLPNCPKVSANYRELFPEVDALLLVLPHHLHHSIAIECLNAGKHVLVEKPMANTEQECLEMIEAAEKSGRVLMVAYCMRFHPLVLEMQRLIQERIYGDVFELSIWTEQYTHPPEGTWIRRADLLGGGQLFSHGCHYIDLMLWMLGRPLKGAHIGTNRGTPWMEREGTSHVTIEFEGGILGYHGATWGARGTRLGSSFHAHCTGGMLEADIHGGKLYVHRGTDDHIPGKAARQITEVLLDVPAAKATEEEMFHFIDCIRTGCKPVTDPVSSLEGLRVIWELYRAEAEGRLADLEGLGLGTHNGLSRK